MITTLQPKPQPPICKLFLLANIMNNAVLVADFKYHAGEGSKTGHKQKLN